MESESEPEREVKKRRRNLEGGRGERFEEFGSGVPEEEDDASMEMEWMREGGGGAAFEGENGGGGGGGAVVEEVGGDEGRVRDEVAEGFAYAPESNERFDRETIENVDDDVHGERDCSPKTMTLHHRWPLYFFLDSPLLLLSKNGNTERRERKGFERDLVYDWRQQQGENEGMAASKQWHSWVIERWSGDARDDGVTATGEEKDGDGEERKETMSKEATDGGGDGDGEERRERSVR
ncbi:hypothetical protein LOK49_LG02G00928 [Camellia lanceoleosa]|uniref:Uncharacterized protein n=1 Tax=Camellia lanceoleosa TaxID=1840588 RepID=A0ACC0ISM7_9ERIC|nr:hypothetical protein LOK49_LG02G00928 [Camellia lanceoleosa]